MAASQTARRTYITNMYLARKPDGSSKYTLAESNECNALAEIKTLAYTL